MVFLHKTKDATVFEQLLNKAIAQAGIAPKILRTDGAIEYLDKEITAMLEQRGIFKQTTCAHQQFQDGKVEKLVDTITSGVRTALKAANLPNKFWGYAAINYVDIYNHLPHASLNFQTPWARRHSRAQCPMYPCSSHSDAEQQFMLGTTSIY